MREDMSENSLNETYGMVYFIQPGDTPEYLEELRSRGFFLVQIKVDEEFVKVGENTVITAVSFDATDPRNYLNPGSAPAHLTTDTAPTIPGYTYITVTDTAGTTSDFYPYPISTNNVTVVVNPDRNLPDQLVCWVTKPQTDSAPMAFISL